MSRKEKAIWIISLLATLVLICSSIYVIAGKAMYYVPETGQIISKEDIDEGLVDWFVSADFSKDPDIHMVPTGIFLESVEFKGANTVKVSGNIWQNYMVGKKEISQGIVFPEATDVSMNEAYRRVEGEREIIGWYFEAEFIQSFEYKAFPFDNKVFWIRMWHKDFDRNVVLVPDLESYDSTNLEDYFGLDPQIVVSGYDIEETYFKYQPSNYDTNFGIKNYIGQKNFPELVYNIALKREISDAFIIYILPLIAIFMLLFFAVLVLTIKDETIKLTGFSFSNQMSTGALLLFLVILSHTQLRGSVDSDTTMFIEYIYFLAYIAILCFVVISFVICNRIGVKKAPMLYSMNSIYIKALFCPVLFLSILIVSVTVF